MNSQDLSDNENDEYYLAYGDAKAELIRCHATNNLNSCLPCEKLLSCPTRLEYVKSVYGNMTKGEEGSFDFN